MQKNLIIFISAFIGIFIIDQNIKILFLDGFRWYGECISLVLAFNKGVAFSMFAFLDEYLKYIQIALILGAIGYVFYDKEVISKYSFPLGMLFGAGSSNVYDRFTHEGVIDYVYWHCKFDFAIFNFADVIIDISVIIIIYLTFKQKRRSNKL